MLKTYGIKAFVESFIRFVVRTRSSLRFLWLAALELMSRKIHFLAQFL
jgi:hypothetical protein